MNAGVIAALVGLALVVVPTERWVEPAHVGAWMGAGAGLWSGEGLAMRPVPALTQAEVEDILPWLREAVKAQRLEGRTVPESVIRLGLWLRSRVDGSG